MITKKDVESFFKVLTFLEKEQQGAFGLGRSYKVELRFFKYAGIGEGMEFESGIESDYELLKEELLKRCKK